MTEKYFNHGRHNTRSNSLFGSNLGGDNGQVESTDVVRMVVDSISGDRLDVLGLPAIRWRKRGKRDQEDEEEVKKQEQQLDVSNEYVTLQADNVLLKQRVDEMEVVNACLNEQMYAVTTSQQKSISFDDALVVVIRELSKELALAIKIKTMLAPPDTT